MAFVRATSVLISDLHLEGYNKAVFNATLGNGTKMRCIAKGRLGLTIVGYFKSGNYLDIGGHLKEGENGKYIKDRNNNHIVHVSCIETGSNLSKQQILARGILYQMRQPGKQNSHSGSNRERTETFK